MEPLSIVASTAAILTIIAKTLVTLNVFINDSANVNQKLSELHSDLNTLYALVDLIRGFHQTPTIKDAIRTIQQDSQINLDCLERALQNCERDVQKSCQIYYLVPSQLGLEMPLDKVSFNYVSNSVRGTSAE